MSLNCKNCGSDQFDIYKGIYTCQYCGQSYRFVPGAGYVKCNPKEMLLLVSVVFKSGYRKSRIQTYDYIYDLDEEVNIGDKVVVLGYNGNETSVEVVKLKVMRIEELPMPINGYKYILRKKEDVAPTPPTPPVEEAPKPTCGTPFINRTYTVQEEVETIPVVQTELPKPQTAQEPWYRSIGELAIYIASLVLLWRLIG